MGIKSAAISMLAGLLSWGLYILVLDSAHLVALILSPSPGTVAAVGVIGGALAGSLAGAATWHLVRPPRWRNIRNPTIVKAWVVGLWGAAGLVPPFTLSPHSAALILAALSTVAFALWMTKPRNSPVASVAALARWAVPIGLAVLFAVGFRYRVVRFGPPHTLLADPAPLNGNLRQQLEYELATERPSTPEAVRGFALRFTSERLRFGLMHRTSLAFDLAEREANCVEYTYLFVAVFNRVAERAGLPTRAHRIRSGTPRVFGMKLPGKSFADHDWALLVGGESRGTEYLDPTLYDIWLGADIEGNVDGAPAIFSR
jgi:hypothetical protein